MIRFLLSFKLSPHAERTVLLALSAFIGPFQAIPMNIWVKATIDGVAAAVVAILAHGLPGRSDGDTGSQTVPPPVPPDPSQSAG